MFSDAVSGIRISPLIVPEYLVSLGKNRADGSNMSSTHESVLAAPVLREVLSSYFTCIIRHGYNYGEVCEGL